MSSSPSLSSSIQSRHRTFDDATILVQQSMNYNSIPSQSNSIVTHELPMKVETPAKIETPSKVVIPNNNIIIIPDTPVRVEIPKKIKRSKERRRAGTVPLPEPWELCCMGCAYLLTCCFCLNCCGMMKD